jgi:hypothetical protein
VRLDLALRHDHGAALRATLRHRGVSVPVLGPDSLASGAAQLRLRDVALAPLPGPAAGEWTLCVEDVDGYGDTGELLSWSLHD